MKEGMIQSDVATVIQPRTLFKPGSWLTKIDLINHQILFNNVLITLSSEKEGGKTSFGTLLQNNLDQQIKPVFITAKCLCTREHIISEITTQLQLTYDTSTDLGSLATQINEQKAHVLLIIDDAHHLPDAFIQEAILTLKNQENFSFFHLCFLADSSLITRLNIFAAASVGSLIHVIELGSLNENEARTYILQRAMTAHLITRPLTDVQFKQFYQLTKGNIAKINSTLEPFVFKCAIQKKKNPMEWVTKAGIATSIVLTAGLVGFYFSKSYDFYPSNPSIIAVNPVQAELIIPEKIKKSGAINHCSTTHTTPTCRGLYSASMNPVDKPRDVVLEMNSQQALERPEGLVSQIASFQDSSNRELLSFSKRDIDEDAQSSIVYFMDKAIITPKVQRNELANAFKADTGLYTIQVVASHNKSNIERFKQNNQFLKSHAQLRHFTNEQGIWYLLTLGEYDRWSLARHDMKKLPITLAKLNPWIRPLEH